MKIDKEGIQFEDKPITKSAKVIFTITVFTVIACMIALCLVSMPSVSLLNTVQRCTYMILLLTIANLSLNIFSLYMVYHALSVLKGGNRG